MTSSDPKAPVSVGDPMRRRNAELTEIAVLEALAVQGETVVAQLGGGVPVFRSRLRFVDPGRQYIVVEPSSDAAANAALLARPRTIFFAEVSEWHIEFAAAGPELSTHDNAAAIRLQFPESISSRRRRMFERAPVPPQSPLRCVASVDDVIYFEANIFDISRDGIGLLQYDPDIKLEAGTVFRGCQIERPGGDPVTVDLEVRYTGPAMLADGSPAQRAGCRFLNLSPASIDLIGQFFGGKS